MADPKPVAIDLLALAFSRSALRDTMTRELLAGQDWDALVKNNVLALDPIWQLAKGQPGFEPKHTMVPLCWFKQHERRLGLIVELPLDMRHLSGTDQSTHAALCPVKRDELERALAPLLGPDASASLRRVSREAQAVPDRAAAKTRELTPVSGETPRKTTVPPTRVGPSPVAERRRRAIMAAVAAVLFLGASGFLSVTILDNCRGSTAKWETIGVGAIKGIPARAVRRLGNQVEVTLADDGWVAQPEDARRRQLAAALDALREQHVDVLAVLDSTKKVRAIAQTGGRPPRTSIKFR